MSEQIEKSFQELVELKYQLYNSLFLTLPLDAVEQTGLLLPLLQDHCIKGYEKGWSPEVIIDRFFSEHKGDLNEKEKIGNVIRPRLLLFLVEMYKTKEEFLIQSERDTD